MQFPLTTPFVESDLPEDGKKAALKVLEESAELVEAVKDWLKSDISKDDAAIYSHMCAEYGDVLQALTNLSKVVGIEHDDIQTGYDIAYRKNELKGRHFDE